MAIDPGCGAHARTFARIVSLAIAVTCSSCSATTAPHETARIELSGADAEVWSFRLRVEGLARGAAQLERCAIECDGRVTAARIERASFAAEVELAPGTNDVSARCRTEDGRTLSSQRIRYDVRLRAGPTAHARIAPDGTLDGRASQPSEYDAAPIARYAWSRVDAEGDVAIGEGETLAVALQAGGRYGLRVTDAAGREDRSEVRVGSDSAWLERAVVYGALPPLFGRAGFRDVADALGRLEEIGVDVLWLAPVFTPAEGDYGYAVVDYFRIREDYGGAAEFGALVRAAHARGMRVWLDLPANHTSHEHRYYRQASQLGPSSHYYTFYDRDPRGRATYYFDWKHLPNLNYDHPEVGRFMREAAQHWVRDFDVDGYRVDAAWGVRQRKADYWPLLRDALVRIEPDITLLAEASALDAYYLGNGFDLAYDWTHELGHHAWEHVFAAAPGVVRRLHAAVQAAPGARVLRYLNNNDTGQRFITKHGEGMTRVATAALLTLPGVPCLYSFDEVGAEYEPYTELRPVSTDNPELRAFHARWIALHRKLGAAAFVPLHTGQGDEVYAYLRRGAADGGTTLIALNFSNAPAKVTLELPDGITGTARELWSGATHAAAGPKLPLELQPWAAHAYELPGSSAGK